MAPRIGIEPSLGCATQHLKTYLTPCNCVLFVGGVAGAWYRKGYNLPTYLERRDGVFYFVRRIPSDVRKHYRRHRIRLSLRTKFEARAMRMVSSMSQRLEDYWLGLRLQDLDIP